MADGSMAKYRRLGIGVFAGLLLLCWLLGTRVSHHEPTAPQPNSDLNLVGRLAREEVMEDSPSVNWDSVQHQSALLTPSFPTVFTPLSQKDVNGVEKFVFFVGYPRSGHSIIGSMMDAHPDIVIAHEFMLFKKWLDHPDLMNRSNLFNALYRDSYQDAKKGWRSSLKDEKGYSLDIASSWQGRFRQLRIIGDKSGGQTALMYSMSSKKTCQIYRELINTVKVPIHIIHVIRNPYDMIATGMLYKSSDVAGEKRNVTKDHPHHDSELLLRKVRLFHSFASAVQGMIKNCHLTNILDIHHADHIKDPKGTLQRICDFLDLGCPEDYLQECDDKTYKQLLKTRELVLWNQKAHLMVQAIIKKFPFFHRYSFDN